MIILIPSPGSRSSAAFLKWAGSKQRLLPSLMPMLPAGKRLVEPFVGAANVFLSTSYVDAVLADTNPVLIELFHQLKQAPEVLIAHARQFFIEANRTSEAYLALRQRYNNVSTSMAERAALFLYLNRFGFNGLYRENRRGQCNTPYGYPKKLPVFPEAKMRAAAHRFNDVTLLCADFEATLQYAQLGDVVYADPPYVEQVDKPCFTAYGKVSFDWGDHVRLAECAKKLANRGIPVVISNHDTPATRKLYEDAELHVLQAYRSMAGKGGERGATLELVAVFR